MGKLLNWTTPGMERKVYWGSNCLPRMYSGGRGGGGAASREKQSGGRIKWFLGDSQQGGGLLAETGSSD